MPRMFTLLWSARTGPLQASFNRPYKYALEFSSGGEDGETDESIYMHDANTA